MMFWTNITWLTLKIKIKLTYAQHVSLHINIDAAIILNVFYYSVKYQFWFPCHKCGAQFLRMTITVLNTVLLDTMLLFLHIKGAEPLVLHVQLLVTYCDYGL